MCILFQHLIWLKVEWKQKHGKQFQKKYRLLERLFFASFEFFLSHFLFFQVHNQIDSIQNTNDPKYTKWRRKKNGISLDYHNKFSTDIHTLIKLLYDLLSTLFVIRAAQLLDVFSYDHKYFMFFFLMCLFGFFTVLALLIYEWIHTQTSCKAHSFQISN